jgi:hypothetical protein
MQRLFLIMLFLSSITFAFGQTKKRPLTGSLSVSKIDSICSVINLTKDLYRTMACGPTTTRCFAYKDKNRDTLLRRSRTIFIDKFGVDYSQIYYYHAAKVIKAVMGIYKPTSEKIYEATYYFDNEQLIKVNGETTRKFSGIEILNCSVKGCFCLPNLEAP